MRPSTPRILLVGAFTFAAGAGCAGDNNASPSPTPTAGVAPQRLYVASEGSVVAYDLDTGLAVEGSVEDVESPYGMQALPDGTVLVNLVNLGEILVVDGVEVTERDRLPASSMGGTRPNDSYISPEHGGHTYWLTLNDGAGTAESNTAVFVDVDPDSASYLTPVGEIPIGVGHHQAAFSADQARVVVSNFNQCDDILSVYDYSDPADIRLLETLTAAEAGFDGSSFEKTCDPTEAEGVVMRPHGCATSAASGDVYCNLAGPGLVVVVDVDADPPTFSVVDTTGSGGGYVKAAEGGAYLYTVQASPREGAGGVDCQVGQLLTLDASTRAIVDEAPILYKGPGCVDVLTGTDEETAGPNHLKLSLDGTKLFLALAGGFGNEAARVRQHVVFDLTDPSAPAQLPSIEVGESSAQRGTAITGDGRFLYVANTLDDTVSEIEIATLTVKRTLAVQSTPKQVATWGGHEGPSLPVGPVH